MMCYGIVRLHLQSIARSNNRPFAVENKFLPNNVIPPHHNKQRVRNNRNEKL